jgi:ditrans,polycis-polyprenyl diphosphate synthase
MLEVCLRLRGVKCVSVYAFSIENFKRSQSEVEALMELAHSGIREICQEGYGL